MGFRDIHDKIPTETHSRPRAQPVQRPCVGTLGPSATGPGVKKAEEAVWSQGRRGQGACGLDVRVRSWGLVPSGTSLGSFKQKGDTILFFLLVKISLVPGWGMDCSKTKYESAGQTEGRGGGPRELYWGRWWQRNGRFEKGFGWKSWQSLDVGSQGKRKAPTVSQVLGQSSCYLW